MRLSFASASHLLPVHYFPHHSSSPESPRVQEHTLQRPWRNFSFSDGFGIPSHIPSCQEPRSTCSALPGWGSYLEQRTDISVITLQGPQLLSGCFLELGIEAPAGAALNREEERNLLKRKCAGLRGRRSSMPHRAASATLPPCSQPHQCLQPSPGCDAQTTQTQPVTPLQQQRSEIQGVTGGRLAAVPGLATFNHWKSG